MQKGSSEEAPQHEARVAHRSLSPPQHRCAGTDPVALLLAGAAHHLLAGR